MSNIKSALMRKLGPFPAWVWAGIAGGAIFFYRRHTASAGASNQQQQNPASVGPWGQDPFPIQGGGGIGGSGDTTGTGGSSGGSSGTDPGTSAPAPPPPQITVNPPDNTQPPGSKTRSRVKKPKPQHKQPKRDQHIGGHTSHPRAPAAIHTNRSRAQGPAVKWHSGSAVNERKRTPPPPPPKHAQTKVQSHPARKKH